VIHDGMSHDPFQGQGHGGLKFAKMADFKVDLLCWYVVKTLIVNYDNPRQF